MSPQSQAEVTVRIARPEDSSVCGQICYDAFAKLSAKHSFPSDVPDAQTATGIMSALFSSAGFYCVVAESEGRIVGSNCLDERSLIAGIGPITVEPGAQNLGAGRKLMQVVMDRARERNPAGIRLVQAAYHNRSLALYTALGFDVREAAFLRAGTAPRKECARMRGEAGATRRFGGVQCAVAPRAWIRSRH